MKAWIATLTLATLAAATLGALGPALNTPSAPAPTEHDRMRAAAQQMCGSENAAWEEVAPGQIQCYSTGGRKLKRTTP